MFSENTVFRDHASFLALFSIPDESAAEISIFVVYLTVNNETLPVD
jgi:hypothetical protein